MKKIIILIIFLVFIAFGSLANAELVGYWNFDENSGNIIHDSSEYHNDGIRDPLGTDWTDGQYGSALHFAPEGYPYSYVTIPDSNNTLILSTEFSFLAWVRISDTSDDRNILTKEGYDSFNYYMNYALGITNNRFYMLFDLSGGYFRALSTRKLIPNKWIHIAVISDAHEIKFYLNGILDIEHPWNKGILIPAPGPLKIGGESSSYGGGEFLGDIDELKIYNHALSNSELNFAMLEEEVSGGEAPVLFTSAEFIEADVNEDVFLSAEGSYDPDGEIIYFRWSRQTEDQTMCFSPEPTCPTKGTGKVKDLIKVQAIDNDGNISEDQVMIVDRLSAYLYFQSQN